MKSEILSKADQKTQYFEERLKMLRKDSVDYTDGRIERLEYGPEQQQFMAELTEKWPLLQTTISEFRQKNDQF